VVWPNRISTVGFEVCDLGIADVDHPAAGSRATLVENVWGVGYRLLGELPES
jgi:hypothetical protein